MYSGSISYGEMLRVQSLPKVDFIEPVARFIKHQIHETYKPNDPLFARQWGLSSSDETDFGIDAALAWDLNYKPVRSPLVCIIDTGVDFLHPDLKHQIWANPGESGFDAKGVDKSSNGIDDDGNGFVDDIRGWDFVNDDNDPMDDDMHGSHVAGIVGAAINNREGIAGTAMKVRLLPIKTLADDGGGSYADAMRGIEYCLNAGARFSNNSYGGAKPSKAFDELMDWVKTKDITLAQLKRISETDVVEEKSVSALIIQLNDFDSKIDNEYRALGKLAGNEQALLINAEREITGYAESLINYANEGYNNDPESAKKFITYSASILSQTCSHQTIHFSLK